MIDFDTPQDRSQSAAEKWNKPAMLEHFGRDDLLPFWVADMEFQAPPEVRRKLVERAEAGIFGYELKRDSLSEAIVQWLTQRHHWEVDPEQLCYSQGIMDAITLLINLHTEKGDGVIIQPPVFFEFRIAIMENRRKVVRNPLIKEEQGYRMDFDDLEEKAANPRNKLLVLCNPHNPVGRVWKKEELQRLGDICQRHGVRVIADEIHGDIVYSGHQYTPFASISDEIAQNTFACLSPAKTFNIASATDAVIVIANPEYRQQYRKITDRYFLDRSNAFAAIAMEAAYRSGEAWLDQMLVYLQANLDFLRETLKTRIPQVQLVEPEGTFLVWLDFTQLGLETKMLERFIIDQARLALNAGYWFGRQGAGYARMTIACPRSMLEAGLSRLESAVLSLPEFIQAQEVAADADT